MLLLENHEALGTHWSIELFDPIDKTEANSLQKAVVQTLTEFEQTYSRFMPSSLLFKLNREMKREHPPQELVEMLTTALDVQNASHGAFNVLVANKLAHHGYGPSFIRTAEEQTKTAHIEMTKDQITLSGPEAIDLGSLGKGYCIGVVSKELVKRGYPYHVVNGGGDMYVTSDHDQPVTVYIQDPNNDNKAIAEVPLKNQALCASSPFLRTWRYNNTHQTHLVQTKNNQERISSSAVIGSDPCLVDALATAVTLVDEKECQSLAQRFDVQYLKITA